MPTTRAVARKPRTRVLAVRSITWEVVEDLADETDIELENAEADGVNGCSSSEEDREDEGDEDEEDAE